MTSDPCGGNTNGGDGCRCDPPFALPATSDAFAQAQAHVNDLMREYGFDPDKPLAPAARLLLDQMLYGNCYIDAATGERVDPATVTVPVVAKPLPRTLLFDRDPAIRLETYVTVDGVALIDARPDRHIIAAADATCTLPMPPRPPETRP